MAHPSGWSSGRASKWCPGVVDLIELNAGGDTLWRQSLSFQPQRLTAERVEAAIASWVDSRASLGQESPGTLRQAYERVLYRPEYLPAVEGLFMAASGEVCLETHERLDNLRVFYAVRRDDPARQPRRILLPDGVWFQDATDTHVWGIRRDELDVPHIVGRRLVPR